MIRRVSGTACNSSIFGTTLSAAAGVLGSVLVISGSGTPPFTNDGVAG